MNVPHPKGIDNTTSFMCSFDTLQTYMGENMEYTAKNTRRRKCKHCSHYNLISEEIHILVDHKDVHYFLSGIDKMVKEVLNDLER